MEALKGPALVPERVAAQQHSLHSTHLDTACDACLLMAQHILQQLCTAVGGSMCMHHPNAPLSAADWQIMAGVLPAAVLPAELLLPLLSINTPSIALSHGGSSDHLPEP